ncbi:MAG: hypothetical protein IJK24_08605, partial [Oscillospiraceae bacterium]|nr:hypothetical protein [Oscillospiraceae bacterium]
SYNRVGQCRDSVIALTLSICPWALCIIVTGCPWQFSCLDKRHFITDTKELLFQIENLKNTETIHSSLCILHETKRGKS